MFYPGVSQLVIEGRSLAKMLPLTVQGHPTTNLFVKCIIIPQVNENKCYYGIFRCFSVLLGKHYLFLFPSKTHKKFPSQLDKSSEILQLARVEMLEKVSNSQPKPPSIINFPASSSEHLYFSQPARFLWGTDKVMNRFVGFP